MLIIFRYWLQALSFVFPKQFFTLLFSATKNLFWALKDLIKTFWWLLLLEIALLALFGKQLFSSAATKTPTPTGFIIRLAIGVASLILSASLLLFIRNPNSDNPLLYIRKYLIRYIQISLFFTLLLIILIWILASFGISKIPSIHWSILLSLQSIELISVFYWLDSGFSFKEIFTSIERGINFFMYNIPFFVVLIIFMWLASSAITYLFFGTLKIPGSMEMFSSKAQSLAAATKMKTSTSALLGFKYFFFLIEFFWISLLMIFYNKRKRITYTSSLFEQK